MDITIKGFNFRVERDGSIFRIIGDKLNPIKGSSKNNGYLQWDSGMFKIKEGEEPRKRVKLYIHRIVAAAYLGLNIDDLTIEVDHINKIRQDNSVNNLRLVTKKENAYAKTGRGFCCIGNKYVAYISLNNKKKNLGSYNTQEEARQKYLEAKAKYHFIPSREEVVSLYLMKPLKVL